MYVVLLGGYECFFPVVPLGLADGFPSFVDCFFVSVFGFCCAVLFDGVSFVRCHFSL